MTTQTPSAWSAEEVQWFASTAYNYSLDLYQRDEAKGCRGWAQNALSLAHYCGDGGHLETVLQEAYATYKLDANDSAGMGGAKQ